ncbi:hypothetical protein WG922_21455 [Ramlibacter sp. AN1015]|uniref:hypothetical protein n=1 Tax=Ramlibacter sp. AN1015 TaxID=3133428 RepID=UPI0030C41C4A
MRDYGKVYTKFWESEDIRALSDDGRLMALYLMTCTHGTIAGVFRLPDGYVCEDMQWASERVAEALSELFAKGFANRCGTTKWVWVRKHLEWNPPENPNQRKAAVKIALSVPAECCWKLDFMRVCGPSLSIEPPAQDNPCETLGEGFLNQKQKQKQKQEREEASPSAPPPTPPAADSRGTRLPADWTLPADWREWAAKTRPDLDPDAVAEGFRDFWIGKPGKDGRKADWQATWRNWVRSTKGQFLAASAARTPATSLAGAL